jgi:hypothetical protein
MTLDALSIDEELRRLQEEEAHRFREKQEARAQEIRRIMADEELVALLRKLLLSADKPETPKTPHQLELSRRAAELFKVRRQEEQPQRGGQSRFVRQIIASYSGEITTSNIGDAVRAAGMAITNIAVGKILRKLEEAEELRVIQPGAGAQPNVYGLTEKFLA